MWSVIFFHTWLFCVLLFSGCGRWPRWCIFKVSLCSLLLTQSTCLWNQRLILQDSVFGDVVLIDHYLRFKIHSHTYTKKKNRKDLTVVVNKKTPLPFKSLESVRFFLTFFFFILLTPNVWMIFIHLFILRAFYLQCGSGNVWIQHLKRDDFPRDALKFFVY